MGRSTTQDPSAPRVCTLLPSEVRAAERVLADAFADNPLNVGVIGGDHARRVHCNAHGMRALLPSALRHGHVLAAHRSDRLVGCLIATPPLGHPLPAPSIASRLRCRVAQGWRVSRRWAQVFVMLDGRHPRLPHWYLGSVGVAPGEQGRGVGSALLAALLRQVDAEDMPTYLETDRHEHIGFYERRGFRVVEELPLYGVVTWRMWRGDSDAV